MAYIGQMKKIGPILVACLLTATSSFGQAAPEGPDALEPPTGDVEEGFNLLEEGGKLVLRGLLDGMDPTLEELADDLGIALEEMRPAMRDLVEMLGDIRNYHPPEKLPNGDIIIRRKEPLDPEMPGPDGEIEL